MAYSYDTMMIPAIEDLLESTESKFILVSLASKRGREITNYLGQLSVGIGAIVPPQVVSTSSKALSIALEEIAAGKIVAVEVDEDDDDATEDGAGADLGDLGSEERALAPAAPRGPARSVGPRR